MAMVSGDVLGHYRLLEKIGEGGMGVVWKALDTTLDRHVAIKVLSADLARDTEFLARFEREARAVAALNHPNIVTLHSVEEDGGVRFLTMELVEGRSLTASTPADGLPLPRYLDLTIPLAGAVAAAHDRGVIHRDLKPANVMVTEDGRIKVLDFGLAQRQGRRAAIEGAEDLAVRTAASRLSGTVSYMSPEQLAGAPLDHRSDIFSLGIMLFEMATGRRPFGGDTDLATAAAILNQTPPLASDWRADLPLHVSRLIRQCIQKDPAERPRSAREIHDELESLRPEHLAARRAGAPSVAVLPFRDRSEAQDQGHLCEGIAEEIIDRLAGHEGLHVASRRSAFRFRSGTLGSREIGLELGVGALLEGSVRKDDARLHVTAELTGVADGFCLWSARFDRDMREVFEIQEEIAQSIARALQLGPGGGREGPSPTPDVEAYELYLRGRQFFHRYSRRGMAFALDQFRRAAERDPGCALAHAGIADCHAFLYLHANRSEDNRRLADEASRRALALDPGCAQAHVSRGLALSLAGQHAGAEAEFEAATRLQPRLFEARYFRARDCFTQGKLEEAARLYGQAMELGPEDYQAPLLVAQIYDDLGRRAEASAARRRGLRVAEEHLTTHPDDLRAVYMAANAMAATGEPERALEWARRAVELDPEDGMLLYNVACVRALAGQTDEALDALERSVRAGLIHREWIENDSNLAPLRSHPRFREVLAWLGG